MNSLFVIIFSAVFVGQQALCHCQNAIEYKTQWGHNNTVVKVRKTQKLINGLVMYIDGKPAMNALVEIYEYSESSEKSDWKYSQKRVAACKTCETGRFSFPHLPSGLYEVRVSLDGYGTQSIAGIKIKQNSSKSNPIMVFYLSPN